MRNRKYSLNKLKNDFTGHTIGRLKVIKYVGNGKWQCECSCDRKTVFVYSGSLKAKTTLSCGCYHKDRILECNLHNLVGQKFGELTVVKYLGNQKWETKCDCGVLNHIVYGGNLVKGHTTSCGHLRGNQKNAQNLVGCIFGELTVIKKENKIKGKERKWTCKCSCGKIISVFGSNLKTGNTKSCGHIHDEYIKSYKKEINNEKDLNLRLRSSFESKEWAKKVKIKHDFTCLCCGQRGGKLHSHHIQSWKNKPELRFDIDNGVCLCYDCHILFHKNHKRSKYEINKYLLYDFILSYAKHEL